MKQILHLRVNGEDKEVATEINKTLLEVLREDMGLTGTKHGCELGECGTCTVLVDGEPVLSCLVLGVEVEGLEILTVEGLKERDKPHPLQKAFADLGAAQCGYCTPGQIMAAEGLLRTIPDPSIEEIRRGMSGNLCRCGTYPNIFKAVRRAAELKRVKGGT